MNFKGHFKLLNQPLDFTKTTIYSKSNEDQDEFIQKEYFYEDGKVLEIIDHINGIISEYEYSNDNNYLIRFYLFEDLSSEKKKLDSIKAFTFSNGKKIREILIDIKKNKQTKIYTGEFKYTGDFLLEECYKYSEEEVCRIKHEWSKDKSVYKITHLDEPDKIKYTIDKNGFVLECLHFEYENSVKKTEYEYKNGKLFKLIEFPHLAYKKTLFGNGIKLIEEAQFMNETEHYYLNNGLLKKEVIKDFETKEIVKNIFYKYEK